MSVFDFNDISAPSLEHFADLRVEVGTPQVLGGTPRGMRRVVPITGGEATGHGWRARVLPGGCDFQLIVSETLSELDARYALETDSGDLIYVQNQAMRSATPEVMARLGEPYVTTRSQGEGSRTHHHGMGLGFFIAKTLLERTGARVQFRNARTGGAMVVAYWRRDAVEAPPEAPEPWAATRA